MLLDSIHSNLNYEKELLPIYVQRYRFFYEPKRHAGKKFLIQNCHVVQKIFFLNMECDSV